jgi:Uma2 family endonuclease
MRLAHSEGKSMATVRPAWGEVFEVPPTTTAEDLLRLPDDGYQYELFEGVLVRTLTSPAHGVICHRLGVELGIYAKATAFPNAITQNALFNLTLPGAPTRTVLAPDLAIMRPSASPTWSVPQDVPLVAVEVVSASQSLAELALKAQEYRQAGVEEVWIIDNHTRTLQIWNAQGSTTLNETQHLTSALLPGFSVSVRYLLDG